MDDIVAATADYQRSIVGDVSRNSAEHYHRAAAERNGRPQRRIIYAVGTGETRRQGIQSFKRRLAGLCRLSIDIVCPSGHGVYPLSHNVRMSFDWPDPSRQE
jgi:hypothetical protein